MTDSPQKPPGNGVDVPEEDHDDGADAVKVATREKEGDAGDLLEIPERLPILPSRDTAAFPGTVMPLQISRERSKRVLDLALAGDRLVAVVAQRSPTTEDPHIDDLYRVGAACVILKMLKVPDGSEHIVVHGLRRVGIESINEEGDRCRRCWLASLRTDRRA